MKERPINLLAHEVRAIQIGRQTQIRRIAKTQPELILNQFWRVIERGVGCDHEYEWGKSIPPNDRWVSEFSPFGHPGDRLWVRESFVDLKGVFDIGPRFEYMADCQPGSKSDEIRKGYGIKWKPSIHMARYASRISLDVISVRVERLQAISTEECLAEGITGDMPRLRYGARWNVTHGQGKNGWQGNPWVWVGNVAVIP